MQRRFILCWFREPTHRLPTPNRPSRICDRESSAHRLLTFLASMVLHLACRHCSNKNLSANLLRFSIFNHSTSCLLAQTLKFITRGWKLTKIFGKLGKSFGNRKTLRRFLGDGLPLVSSCTTFSVDIYATYRSPFSPSPFKYLWVHLSHFTSNVEKRCWQTFREVTIRQEWL